MRNKTFLEITDAVKDKETDLSWSIHCHEEIANKACAQSGLKDSFPWDPLNMTSERVELAEIKNGRLAMVRACVSASEFDCTSF